MMKTLILLSPLLGFLALFSNAIFQQNGLPEWSPILFTLAVFMAPPIVLSIVLYFTPKHLKAIFRFAGILPTALVTCWIVGMTLLGPPDAQWFIALFLISIIGLVAMPFSILLSYFMYKQMEKYERRK